MPTESLGGFFRHTGNKTVRAIIEWLAHCLVVAALLGGMRVLQLWTGLLWEGQEILFMQLIPLDELFKTADFILLSAVLLLGIGCVVRAYRGEL